MPQAPTSLAPPHPLWLSNTPRCCPLVSLCSDNENKKLKELLKQSIEEIEALPAGATVQLHGAPGPGGNLLHAMNTVRVWLQSGECGKKTADNFYVYLQSIHNKLLELKRAEEVRAEQRHAEDVAFWTQLSTQVSARVGNGDTSGSCGCVCCAGGSW